ncbi:MAG: hypothetical protein GY861_26490 [bacterium]|nr:hypothetical protein [bacterium]
MSSIFFLGKDCDGYCKNNSALRSEVFLKIMRWCIQHSLFTGEAIMQSDTGLIEAPVLISEIVDELLKFEVVDRDCSWMEDVEEG